MNKWEQKIRICEQEWHRDLFIKHRNGTKSKLPDVQGYILEDAMLSDCMVWLNNTHKPHEIKLKNGNIVNELISIYHIENEGTFGGKYGAMQGAISKGKGKKKGVLDLCSNYLGLTCYIEAKLENHAERIARLEERTALIAHR